MFCVLSIISLFITVTLWVASVSLCVGASQRIPLSVLARNPRETGSGRGKGDPREDRESQLTKETRRRREQKGPVNKTVSQGYESRAEKREEQKSER